MEIRLAHYQGLLAQKSLNKFQRFAADYWLRLDRRTQVRDINDTLEKQVWYLDPERFDELFTIPQFGYDGESLVYGEGPVEEVQDDLDEIDRYFEQLEDKKSLSGAQLFQYLGEADSNGWV